MARRTVFVLTWQRSATSSTVSRSISSDRGPNRASDRSSIGVGSAATGGDEPIANISVSSMARALKTASRPPRCPRHAIGSRSVANDDRASRHVRPTTWPGMLGQFASNRAARALRAAIPTTRPPSFWADRASDREATARPRACPRGLGHSAQPRVVPTASGSGRAVRHRAVCGNRLAPAARAASSRGPVLLHPPVDVLGNEAQRSVPIADISRRGMRLSLATAWPGA